jgi:D-beta-D-heptose 7-phosphate kinase/D-beta-D-heptose 1-phosphate adenosyltransferase
MKSKIQNQSDLLRAVDKLRARGKHIVFTNGCFELLHVGHVGYLQTARELGDVLVVGLNSDASVRAIKGPPRPLVPETERAELLAALEAVDFVVIFDEPTAENLVAALKPDTYVKGGDYKVSAEPANATNSASKPITLPIGQKIAPEMRVVQGYGGKIVVLPYTSGHSTTTLIENILQVYGQPR